MFLIFLLLPLTFCCVHDTLGHNHKLVTLDDSQQQLNRLLQQQTVRTTGKILLETSMVNTETIKGKSLVKIAEIAKAFWENTIEIERLSVLSYPLEGRNPANIMCYDLKIPQKIVESNYPNKDYGFIFQELFLGPVGEVARSFPCAQLSSNKRPIWALISFNTDFFQLDPSSFQNSIYVAIHEMTHCLGFSYMLYSSFVQDPRVNVNGMQYLNSSSIQRELKRQFNCDSAPGMLIQSNGQSGGTAGSHWSRKAFGNEFMTATVMFSNPTISYLTLALLQSTGWYNKVNTHFADIVTYSHNSGCKMLDPNDCSAQQFCSIPQQKSCDFDYLAGSHCTTDTYSNKCSYFQYYSNYVCTDPTYTNKKINNFGDTGQTPGYNSRCFVSTIRGLNQSTPKHNMRCYQVTCNRDSLSITIQVGTTKVACKNPNQQIKVRGYDGTINCPKDFKRFCKLKSCPQNCYSNGVCVNGKCICSDNFTGSYCMYQKTGGATMSLDSTSQLFDKNAICMTGTYMTQLGDCDPCSQDCAKCNSKGCQVCFNGNLPLFGHCN